MPEPLARAFPPNLEPSIAEALDRLPQADLPSNGSISSAWSGDWPLIAVEGERVRIPQRIYHPVPPKRLAPEGSKAGLAIDCLYTRHNDGFIRQAALRRVLTAAGHPWTVPFVVQLLGEYVLEICEDISEFAKTELSAHPSLADLFHSFAEENPEFVVLTQQRATSYWDRYHRYRHPSPSTYPGLRALTLMVGGHLPDRSP